MCSVYYVLTYFCPPWSLPCSLHGGTHCVWFLRSSSVDLSSRLLLLPLLFLPSFPPSRCSSSGPPVPPSASVRPSVLLELENGKEWSLSFSCHAWPDGHAVCTTALPAQLGACGGGYVQRYSPSPCACGGKAFGRSAVRRLQAPSSARATRRPLGWSGARAEGRSALQSRPSRRQARGVSGLDRGAAEDVAGRMAAGGRPDGLASLHGRQGGRLTAGAIRLAGWHLVAQLYVLCSIIPICDTIRSTSSSAIFRVVD